MKSTEVVDYFDKASDGWGGRYVKPHDDIRDHELIRRQQLALETLSRLVNKSDAILLDIGCGVGNTLDKAVQLNDTWRGLGIDISEQMIRKCQETYADQARLSFTVWDIEKQQLDCRVDAVISLGVFNYLGDFATVFKHIASMLNPGGYLIFTINKPSLPHLLTSLYRTAKAIFKPDYKALNISHVSSVKEVERLLASSGYEILNTYDYVYLPYAPGLRNLVPVSTFLERYLGKRVTPLSLTTMYVTQLAPPQNQ